MDGSGRMQTGWFRDGDTWYYADGSGRTTSGGWLNQGGCWYWLSSSGVMQTGWLWQGGGWYWLDPETGRMCVGAVNVDGTTYYFYGSGRMIDRGWVSVSDGKVGLVGSDGIVVSTYEGFIDGSGVHLAALYGLYGWQVFEDKWVFVEDSGALERAGCTRTEKHTSLMMRASGLKIQVMFLIPFGAKLVSWLWSHEHDGYYVGTPYSYSFSIPTCTYPNGSPRSDGFTGMNCTGFVAHAYAMSGGVGDPTVRLARPKTILHGRGSRRRQLHQCLALVWLCD